MTKTHKGVLGRTVSGPLDHVEVLQIGATPKTVRAVTNEVYALCPVTEQPDLYKVEIEYEPVDGYVIESKALKMYLWKFRDRGISCEELSATMANELHADYVDEVGKNIRLSVTVTQQPRGGIELTAFTEVGN